MNDRQELIERIRNLQYPGVNILGGKVTYTIKGSFYMPPEVLEAIASAWLEDKEEAERQANFKAMVYVLLSLSGHSMVITSAAIKEDPDDYEIVTKPDSRLFGVEYVLTNKSKGE